MRVTLIAALARNRVIGIDGGLPWRLPDDFAHFKRTTRGHTVIMGRRTYESMGTPLPERRNIVLTSRAGFEPEGVEVVRTLDAALQLAETAGETDAFIIGGSAVYAAAMDRADRMVLTFIDAEPEGDTRFPEYDADAWRTEESTHHDADERHAHAFDIVTLTRDSPR